MVRSSGKVGVTLIIVLAFVVGLVVMALSTGEGPSSAAANFMDALAKQDAPRLAEMSYADGVSQEEIEEQWRFTMEVVAPYYQFSYDIQGEKLTTEDRGFVWMDYVKNAGSSGAYAERFELPMVKTEDGWKVDVYAINRNMFPGLPR